MKFVMTAKHPPRHHDRVHRRVLKIKCMESGKVVLVCRRGLYRRRRRGSSNGSAENGFVSITNRDMASSATEAMTSSLAKRKKFDDDKDREDEIVNDGRSCCRGSGSCETNPNKRMKKRCQITSTKIQNQSQRGDNPNNMMTGKEFVPDHSLDRLVLLNKQN
jgi:hypothetical protein